MSYAAYRTRAHHYKNTHWGYGVVLHPAWRIKNVCIPSMHYGSLLEFVTQGPVAREIAFLRRQNALDIQEAIMQSGAPGGKSAQEMESQVFSKAKNKEEYMSLISRFVHHIKDTVSKQKMFAVQQQQQGQGQVTGMQGMGAMQNQQNLGMMNQVGVGVMNSSGHVNQASMHPGVQHSQQMMGMPTSQSSQVIQPNGMMNQNFIAQSQMNTQMQDSNIAMQIPHSTAQMQNIGQNSGQHTHAMGGRVGSQQIAPNRMIGPNSPMTSQINTIQQQTRKITHRPPNVDSQGIGSPFPNAAAGQHPRFMAPNSSPGMAQGPPSSLNIPGQLQAQQNFANSPSSSSSIQNTAVSGINSIRPFASQLSSVPSPNANVNTPMQTAPTASPRSAEDQACMEKIKELKKYTDLLQRMITKIGNDDMEKSSKMKKLLEILTNPNQRVSMEILLKCEIALKKMEQQHHEPATMSAISSTTAQPVNKEPIVSPFQRTQDTIIATVKNSTFPHSFFRTFLSTVEALTGLSNKGGPSTYDDVVSKPKATKIPAFLELELKSLDPRFKLRVLSFCGDEGKFCMLVKLLDPRLPAVPPLRVQICSDYPASCPTLIGLQHDYRGTNYLKSIGNSLKSRLVQLSESYLLTELLRLWEITVRQSCTTFSRNLFKRPLRANGRA